MDGNARPQGKQLFSVRGQRYPYPEYSIDGALFREFYEMPYFLSSEDVQRVEVIRSALHC